MIDTLIPNILKITGLIVWLVGFGVVGTYAYALVSWVIFWRWGKGARDAGTTK